MPFSIVFNERGLLYIEDYDPGKEQDHVQAEYNIVLPVPIPLLSLMLPPLALNFIMKLLFDHFFCNNNLLTSLEREGISYIRSSMRYSMMDLRPRLQCFLAPLSLWP